MDGSNLENIYQTNILPLCKKEISVNDTKNTVPSFGEMEEMRNKPEYQTPLMKAYNKLAENKEQMSAAIILQMNKMIQKGMVPSWETFTATKVWLAMSMNLTQVNRERYEKQWNFLFQQLTQPVEESNDTENRSEKNNSGSENRESTRSGGNLDETHQK